MSPTAARRTVKLASGHDNGRDANQKRRPQTHILTADKNARGPALYWVASCCRQVSAQIVEADLVDQLGCGLLVCGDLCERQRIGLELP